jgi:FlaG/FlaF family flagellin (archaellin)
MDRTVFHEGSQRMIMVKNDEAMTPVIGTILMVMISVMLGAIIGVYAFGMSASVQNIRMIAMSVV